MATVTDEIKKLLKQKDQQVVTGQQALGGILADLRKQTINELMLAQDGSYAAYQLKQNLTTLEQSLADFQSKAEREIDGQLSLAWEMGSDLLNDVGNAGDVRVGIQLIPDKTLDLIKEFTFNRVKDLSNSAWLKIRSELVLGVLGQKTPQQVTEAIVGSLDSPGFFKNLQYRAEMIVKTEMGRAYSTATIEAMRQAAATVPELRKEWWHAGHPKKPRINHMRLHGQRKPVNEPFLLGSVIIDYPRDPKAPLSEVMNCGCEVVPWHPDWDKESQKLDFYKRVQLDEATA